MKKFIILAIVFASSCLAQAQSTVSALTIESLTNPIGIDLTNPRFSWKLSSDKRNTVQTAYEIRLAADAALLGKKTLWNSGKVSSDQSIYVPYSGPALESGKKYFWQVRVWDNSGKVGAWSEPAFWQMALLKDSDWKARWIQHQDSIIDANPYLRKSFSISKKIA